MAESLQQRLEGAMVRGLGTPGHGTTAKQAEKASEDLVELGVLSVGIHSKDEEIAEWEKKLWTAQDDAIEAHSREWWQCLHYVAGHQFLTWHRDMRRWIERKTLPWRILSMYNVLGKATNTRVSRLTENKPAVTVQAATTDRSDVEKAEYKEVLFWYLWDRLSLHRKVVHARRWATKCASGFLKAGWDPDAGREVPVTKKLPQFAKEPLQDGMGQPVLDFLGEPVVQDVYVGVEEWYVDEKGNPILLVEETSEGEDGEVRTRRNPVPDEADTYCEGDPYVDVRSPFNVRWDPYTDDLSDSWVIQDAEILPASKIMALFPDAAKVLGEAEPASEEDKAIQWSGMRPRQTGELLSDRSRASDSTPEVDREYLVRETWIFPKNKLIKKLWGKKGALIVTVGGKLLSKTELPEWALEACPFVQVIDTPEEGSHYGKPPLRDLLPLQDDINRMRSHLAEGIALRSRLLMYTKQNHQLNMSVMGGLPGTLVTGREKPEPLDLGSSPEGVDSFLEASIAAVADLGNMNDASTGKLPSAGLAAKAIYALQYADERSITETSNLQDISLSRLAKALDSITRHEYKEARKVRIVGEDRDYLVEHEISPDHLDMDVDYRFTPGSMLSRQKEAVKNEITQLMELGLIEPWKAKKYLPVAVPDLVRGSSDLQEAKAKRTLKMILHGEQVSPQPDPWEDPQIGLAVFEEFMLGYQWGNITEQERQLILARWNAYKMMLQPAMPGAPMAPPTPPVAAEQAPEPFPVAEGIETMTDTAEAVMGPPEGFGEPLPQ